MLSDDNADEVVGSIDLVSFALNSDVVMSSQSQHSSSPVNMPATCLHLQVGIDVSLICAIRLGVILSLNWELFCYLTGSYLTIRMGVVLLLD